MLKCRARLAKARPLGNALEGEVATAGCGGCGAAGAGAAQPARAQQPERAALSHCPTNISVARLTTNLLSLLHLSCRAVKRTVRSDPWSVVAVLSDGVILAVQPKVYRYKVPLSRCVASSSSTEF